ncbi:MAG: NAD(P)-binding domain-containing protein, partial [Betaproteobacteria bacterium]|nr:NAD(P)-binding domain-containing protein [Betaproteobacteria bacterium]
MKLAFLGLGVMGYPMAGHLQAKGHSVTVYNRPTATAEAWAKQYGGAFSADIAGAVAGAEMVMMCVGNDNDLMEVGQIALAAMPPGTILVDHTTASADAARTLFKMAAGKGVGFIDAPVSGGQAGAVNGQL